MDLVQGRDIPVAGLLRAARAIADLSQRALAQRAGFSKGAISRLESDDTGTSTTVATFVHALNACGFTVTVHAQGRRLMPDDDPERDRAQRRYPPHLDPHPLSSTWEWWSLKRMPWLLTRVDEMPARTYHVSPNRRARYRERLAHPWAARFWEDTAHLAPPFSVHPMLERRRRELEQAGAWARRWDELQRRSGAGDGGADEGGGDVA